MGKDVPSGMAGTAGWYWWVQLACSFTIGVELVDARLVRLTSVLQVCPADEGGGESGRLGRGSNVPPSFSWQSTKSERAPAICTCSSRRATKAFPSILPTAESGGVRVVGEYRSKLGGREATGRTGSRVGLDPAVPGSEQRSTGMTVAVPVPLSSGSVLVAAPTFGEFLTAPPPKPALGPAACRITLTPPANRRLRPALQAFSPIAPCSRPAVSACDNRATCMATCRTRPERGEGDSDATGWAGEFGKVGRLDREMGASRSRGWQWAGASGQTARSE